MKFMEIIEEIEFRGSNNHLHLMQLREQQSPRRAPTAQIKQNTSF